MLMCGIFAVQWNTIVVHLLTFVVIFLVTSFGLTFLSNHYLDLVEINDLRVNSELGNWS